MRVGMWDPERMPDVPDELDLSAPQARVLGCLIEKRATTPLSYPMTLKALTTACNQNSNRYPVVEYEGTLVEATVHALKGKGLARVVHPAHGERATKYRHIADEALGLDPAELAVISVLLLRGAQTASELRTRTDRSHHFGSTAEVETVLTRLSGGDDSVPGRDISLVVPVDRQPGQKEQRWIQLLESDPEARALAAPAPNSVAARGSGHDSQLLEDLTERVDVLEQKLSMLIEALSDLVSIQDPSERS